MSGRGPALGAVALALVLVASALASPVNEPAPALEAKEWVGAPLDWQKERGKVVLILFVTPRQKDSEAALKDQVDMLKRRGKDGLDTILVSDARKEDVDLWARTVARGSSWRIAVEAEGRISIAFMVQNNPFAVVVDRDGKDVFEGHALRERVLISKAIDEALDRPPTLQRGATSARLKPAWGAWDHHDWKAAVVTLTAVRDDPAATPEDTRDAKTLLWMVGVEGKKASRAALARAGQDEWYEAVLALDELAAAFAGLPVADEMKKLADDLRKDPKLKKELAAGEDLHKALALAKEGKMGEAEAKVKALESKYKGTKTAAGAKKKLDALKAGGK